MKPAESILHFSVAGILLSGAMLYASEISGVVTNRTTGKPAAGDTIAVVDAEAGMREMARTTTDTNGR